MPNSSTSVQDHCESTWRQAREGIVGRLLPLTYGICPAGDRAISLALSLVQPSMLGLRNLTALRLDGAKVSEVVARVVAVLDGVEDWGASELTAALDAAVADSLDREVVVQLATFGLTTFGLPEVLEALGKGTSLDRLRQGAADYRCLCLIG